MMILTVTSLIKINNNNHLMDFIQRKNSKIKTESNKLSNKISNNYLCSKKALPSNFIKKSNKTLPKIPCNKNHKKRKKLLNLSAINQKRLLLLSYYSLSSNSNQSLKATQIMVLFSLLKWLLSVGTICQFKTKSLTKNFSKFKGKSIKKKWKNIGETFLKK